MAKGLKGHLTVRLLGGDAMDRLRKQLKASGERAVAVGVLEGAGNYTDGPSPPSVADVALWNEFGTETIPERSFIRATATENRDKIIGWQRELMAKVLDGSMDGTQALQALGFRMQVLVQNKIKSGVPPENAPRTIARKRARGSMGGRTLIDTGLLLRSITFDIIGASEDT